MQLLNYIFLKYLKAKALNEINIMVCCGGTWEECGGGKVAFINSCFWRIVSVQSLWEIESLDAASVTKNTLKVTEKPLKVFPFCLF